MNNPGRVPVRPWVSCKVPRRPKRTRRNLHDPDRIRFIRGILARILNADPQRNPIFVTDVLDCLDELARIKSLPPPDVSKPK